MGTPVKCTVADVSPLQREAGPGLALAIHRAGSSGSFLAEPICSTEKTAFWYCFTLILEAWDSVTEHESREKERIGGMYVNNHN